MLNILCPRCNKPQQADNKQLAQGSNNNNKKDIKEKSRKHKIDNKTNRRLVGLGACADLTTRSNSSCSRGFCSP